MVSLTDAEWKLMNALWQHSESTITQLVAFFAQDTKWSKHTVISMLTRLESKGAVKYIQSEKAKKFYAVIDRQAAQIEETDSFLSKLYDGSLNMMLNTMVNKNRLTKEEINQLYEILKKAEAEEDA